MTVPKHPQHGRLRRWLLWRGPPAARAALFLLAVLLAAWYAGPAADRLPLIFNSLVRLSMFCGGVWLAAELRRVLERESCLACSFPGALLPEGGQGGESR